MATYPIWKDTAVSVPHGYLFRISGGTDEFGNTGVFYVGRAVSPSGSGTVTVYMNRLCAVRIKYGAPAPFTTTGLVTCCQPQAFTMQQSADGNTWTTIASHTFIPDWSYGATPAGPYLGAPINGHFHYRMVVFYSGNGSASGQMWIDRGNGQINQGSVSVPASGGTWCYPLSSATPPFVSCGIGPHTWGNRVDCATHALYYRNPYGGWDSFLIEGNVVESNAPDRWTRKVHWVNTNISSRGEVNYASELVKRWTMHTHRMTDDESSRMWMLLTSNDAYVHDFAKGLILPVILEDGSQDEKTYKNNGRKMVTYTITCRLAQDRLTM